jgi:hypothetical protein
MYKTLKHKTMDHLIPNNKDNKPENHSHETHTGKELENTMRMIMNGGKCLDIVFNFSERWPLVRNGLEVRGMTGKGSN